MPREPPTTWRPVQTTPRRLWRTCRLRLRWRQQYLRTTGACWPPYHTAASADQSSLTIAARAAARTIARRRLSTNFWDHPCGLPNTTDTAHARDAAGPPSSDEEIAPHLPVSVVLTSSTEARAGLLGRV